MTSQKSVYLVTGASRGIGKELVRELSQRANTTVIACVRADGDPRAPFSDLSHVQLSQLIVIRLDCSEREDTSRAIEELRTVHGVHHIDVVIANAAIASDFATMSTVRVDRLEHHMMVNVYSVLLLFQAARPLLEKSSTPPKLVLIGAQLGSLSLMKRYAHTPTAAYSLSKATANYVIRKLHFENEWLIAFVVDPGYVQTDMGNRAARALGKEKAPTTVEESVQGIVKRIDEAKRENYSGEFVTGRDGSSVPW